MTLFVLAAAAAAIAQGSAPAAAEATPDYAPLNLYRGSWQVNAAGAPQARLDNICGRIGTLFGCEQIVDGKPGAYILFVPTAERGKWKTQNMTLDGRSSATAGDLTIEGDLWTYMGSGTVNGVTTWTRVTNQFSGADKAHFEVAHSTDGKTWAVAASGDETRVK